MDRAELVALRREVHAHPEPAFCEVRTAATVLAHLRKLPAQVRTGSAAMRRDGIPAYPDEATLHQFAARAVDSGSDARYPSSPGLNAEMVRAVTSPEVREKLIAQGLEPIGSKPEIVTQWTRDGLARMRDIVQRAKIQAE